MMDPTAYLGALSRRKMMAFSGMTGLGAVAPLSLAAFPAFASARETNGDSGANAAMDLPWPERGSFGGKAVVGPHRASAAAMIDPRPIFGLPRERTFFYGNLRDTDGNLYEVVRGIAGPGFGGLDGLLVQSSVGKETLRMEPQLTGAAARSTGSTAKLEGGDAVWASAPDAAGKPFRITMSADGTKST
jgi:hypothetical protein